MPQFSKTILPPVLEYTYPAFAYESATGGNVKVSFPGALSITNKMEQIDHLQVRIVSLDTNKNGLNPSIFPVGLYFISTKNMKDLVITLNTVINNQNIFKTSENDIYPSYYKMQVRLGEKNEVAEKNYDPSWGQNVSKNWLLENSKSFSEWSNSAILKTVKEPDFGVFTLEKNILNTITDPDYTWNGYYYTDDDNESLEKYSFKLEDESLGLLEESPLFYIGEYETPSLRYKFREILEHDKIYFLSLTIETVTGYRTSIRYKLHTVFDYVKIYNIIEILEDDEDAHNLVDIRARQIHLVPEKPPIPMAWKSDANMGKYGESGVTHYQNYSKLFANKDFSIPYENFSMLLSITNFKNKIQTKLRECFQKDNYLCYLGQNLSNGTDFYLGVYNFNNKLNFVLKEELKDSKRRFVHYYIIKDQVYEDNKEFLFLIQKNMGDTIFKAVNWHNNNFNQ